MRIRQIIVMMLFLAVALTGLAQESTTIAPNTTSRVDTALHIREVIVTSKLTFREVIPSQKLSGEQLQRMSALSVADAMRYFSGVQLKDYGGVGGVKTVDVRSMGTNHLGVSYDGIVLGNAQNGQIDLGQFSLDNVDEIALYNGQKSATSGKIRTSSHITATSPKKNSPENVPNASSASTAEVAAGHIIILYTKKSTNRHSVREEQKKGSDPFFTLKR